MYVGGRLAPWFDTSPNHRACHRMADEMGDHMTSLVRRNTPVQHGHLRASILKKLTVVRPGPHGTIYESGCETNVEYAPYVEHGTGLWGPKHAMYEIRPKNPDGWLRWIDPHTGKPIFAKRVMHPGSPGNHMFEIGAAIAEHEFDHHVQPILTEWAREVEQQNHTGIGRP